MSLSSASPVDKRGSPTASPYARDDSDDDDVSYRRNGSVNVKLFAKNPLHVAVADQVPGHHYEEQDEEEYAGELNVSDSGSDGGAEIANGNGHADLEDEDDDDEFIPGASDDDSGGESDADADEDDGELCDEEMSMRGLLAPMAKYAKQLLFLGEDDDDSDFDDQDAELWDSLDEKHEWIERYEAMNRLYMDQYGCRIDAPANPDIQKRLRRERSREAKYSLVLLALAVAYLVRLLMGPVDMPAHDAVSSTAPLSPTRPTSESGPSPPVPEATRAWETTSPPWWTVWTEELVVRVLAWPRSVIISMQATETTTAAVETSPSDKPTTHSSHSEKVPSDEASTPGPTAVQRPVDDNAQTSAQPLESEIVIIEREVEVSAIAVDEIEVSTASPMPATHLATEAPSGDGPASEDEHTHNTPIEISRTDNSASPDNFDVAVGTEMIRAQQAEAAEEDTVATNTDVDVVADERTLQEEDDQREKTAAGSFKRCHDMLYMLVKMKHDVNVKTTAIKECERAVEDASNPASIHWSQARVLRGDLRSLTQSFRDAQADYEAALANDAVQAMATFRSEIRVKITANRWVEYYHTKKFKEFRNDCLRLTKDAATAPTTKAPDRVVELARDWLRAFRKETTVLDVLTQTRACTLFRPAVQQKSKD